MNKFFILALLIASSASAQTGDALKKTAKKIEEHIAGGPEPERPRDVIVKVRGNRIFLEGSVDTEEQRREALEICKSFVSEKDSCVMFVRLRAGQPEDPKPMLRVEYRLISVPRAEVSAANMLGKGFHGSKSLPKDAKLLKAVAFTILDGENPSSAWDDKSMLRISETFQMPKEVAVSDKTQIYTFEASSRGNSVRGSDKVIMDFDVKIRSKDGVDERQVRTSLVLSNHDMTGLGAWVSTADGKDAKASGVLLVVEVVKLRSASSSISSVTE